MKVSFFFSLREIRRRPRGFLALVAVSAALLTTLIMMLLYLNADWRNDVMPLKESNYHFYIQDLDESEKGWINAQPWCLKVYNEMRYDSEGTLKQNTLRVRVIWSENINALKYAREVFDRFDLWTSPTYVKRYNSYYESKLALIRKEYLGLPEDTMLPHGMTIRQEAENQAKNKLLTEDVRNDRYMRAVINTYIIRPEFFTLLTVFALFLSGAMVILISERYRVRMAEFGALRSIGLKKRQLWYINGIDNIISSIVSIPIGIALAAGVVKLYSLVFADILADDSVYLKLEENLPIAATAIVAVMMAVASLAGCMLVCYLFRERTVMELLKKEGSVRVSWVAKTSPRFEKAKSSAIYETLASRRTKLTFILATAIIVIMMPLPLAYLIRSVETLTTASGDTSKLAEGIYYIFQAGVLFVTSMLVTYISSRSSTERRHGEFGILRSLGMNKRAIRRTAFRRAIKQIAFTCVPAVLLFMKVSDTTSYSRTSSINRELDVNIPEFLAKVASESAGVALLITPPILLGVALSLLRFGRRSVIESIRDNE